MEKQLPTLSDYKTIKTYEDACTVLGVKPIDEAVLKTAGVEPHIIALMKLETISRALWGLNFKPVPQPDWDGQTWYWFSWWGYYSQKEVDDIIANKDNYKSAALFGGGAGSGSDAGFGYLGTGTRPSGAGAGLGFRLCQETKAKAEYFAHQFAELWVEYLNYEFQITKRLL